MIVHFWRWWRDSWRDPKLARVLYFLVAAAFAGLGIVAAVTGDIAVAVVAIIAALATIVLAIVLSRILGKEPEEPSIE
jgi:hypothetical protein